ncbi:hypothetical protein GCM10022239_10260 [Leifsonia bigeumensis]|uniref:Uncharacterized protein n=1 Tax=Leifsonella bigeumensis TaxID=433643 RepID=A0ABP7FFY4_9MICO
MASQVEAKDALWSAIEKLAKEAERYNSPAGSVMLRDTAIAYRAVVGGAQPGSMVVESK